MTIAEHTGRAAMQSVDSYLSEVLAAIRPVPPRELRLDEADGGVLTEDVTAAWPLPPFDNSGMDGYAVLAADVAAATPERPVTLPVSGEVPAGDTARHDLAPGTCMRIMTGAPLPSGADAVVPVEWTDAGRTDAGRADGTGQVSISQPAEPGHAIRRTGGDAVPGDLLLAAGTRLGPVQLALLAAAGRGTVTARPKPRITVMSTGNELVEPGQPVSPGQIWESNSRMLAGAAQQAGCLARRHPIVPDDKAAVLAAIEDALADADLLVTTGGVSMGGEHDVVKAALQDLGTVAFRKVAMQPGMPQGFGVVGPDRTPIFTLPGNPVSAYVSFQLFVRPAVGVLQGIDPERVAADRATLAAPVRSPAGRRSYLRGILDSSAGTVAPVSGQSSHQLAALARANVLIIVPDSVTEMPEGADVDVLVLP
jgi:molybdopterin molybdotransferase